MNSSVGYLCIGKIVKPHGYKGEVNIELTSEYGAWIQKLESVFLEQQGKSIPFFITKISIHQKRGVLAFEKIQTEAQAIALKGARILVPENIIPTEEADVSDLSQLIGFTATDRVAGTLGSIIDFYDLPTNPLLAVEVAGKEILIPIHPHFIAKIERSKKIIHFQLPDGLVELYTTGGTSEPDDQDASENNSFESQESSI